ncbi:unnamed protein product [Adineta steineri]|uniref:Protein sleepless n=1 Tax=Adineta steineri TaxID=433720 RepID=A0A818LAL5_9BILA|nr:unnamed protein product [Adineta steineri]CAF3563340.1 unnamed protein product [Adineta steineri]CAF4288676.1 unnamed protein product [Adineta steineri]
MQSIFILLVTLGCISVVNTYQCYSCDGFSNGDCNDPFNATGTITDRDKMTAGPGEVCMKIKIETKGGTLIERGTNSIGASCIGGQNGCKKQKESGVTATICCCTSDICNGVSVVQQKPLIICLTMSTLFMFAYRWY